MEASPVDSLAKTNTWYTYAGEDASLNTRKSACRLENIHTHEVINALWENRKPCLSIPDSGPCVRHNKSTKIAELQNCYFFLKFPIICRRSAVKLEYILIYSVNAFFSPYAVKHMDCLTYANYKLWNMRHTRINPLTLIIYFPVEHWVSGICSVALYRFFFFI